LKDEIISEDEMNSTCNTYENERERERRRGESYLYQHFRVIKKGKLSLFLIN
jgi:hypothetical protein